MLEILSESTGLKWSLSFAGVSSLNFAVFSRLGIRSQRHSCYLVNDNREKVDYFEGAVLFVCFCFFNLQQILLLLQLLCLFSVNKRIKLITQ